MTMIAKITVTNQVNRNLKHYHYNYQAYFEKVKI